VDEGFEHVFVATMRHPSVRVSHAADNALPLHAVSSHGDADRSGRRATWWWTVHWGVAVDRHPTSGGYAAPQDSSQQCAASFTPWQGGMLRRPGIDNNLSRAPLRAVSPGLPAGCHFRARLDASPPRVRHLVAAGGGVFVEAPGEAVTWLMRVSMACRAGHGVRRDVRCSPAVARHQGRPSLSSSLRKAGSGY